MKLNKNQKQTKEEINKMKDKISLYDLDPNLGKLLKKYKSENGNIYTANYYGGFVRIREKALLTNTEIFIPTDTVIEMEIDKDNVYTCIDRKNLPDPYMRIALLNDFLKGIKKSLKTIEYKRDIANLSLSYFPFRDIPYMKICKRKTGENIEIDIDRWDRCINLISKHRFRHSAIVNYHLETLFSGTAYNVIWEKDKNRIRIWYETQYGYNTIHISMDIARMISGLSYMIKDHKYLRNTSIEEILNYFITHCQKD